MLIGSVNHAIDPKGRYTVPAKFRNDLGDRFVITEGIGGCLFIFTLEQWETVSRRLAELPATDENTLRFKRRFFSRAYDLEIDKQFRFVLPPLLRDLAHIDRDVVSVGMTSRLEVWSRETWEQYDQEDDIPEKDATNILAGLVL